MKMTATTARRGLYGMFAAGMFGGIASAAIVMPTANAAPDAVHHQRYRQHRQLGVGVHEFVSGIASRDQQELTDIAKQPQEQAQEAYRAYFADNPQVETDLKAIHQPVVDLSTQCGLEVTPTPVVGGAAGALIE